MSLITNITSIFSDTIGNLNGVEERFQDINDSLNKAINAHIALPEGNEFVICSGFGPKWLASYSKDGLPTNALNSYANWIDPLLSPILADALAAHINACSVLMTTTTPATAQVAAPLVATVLALFPGGQAIATTMTTAIASAVASTVLTGIPALVATGLVGLAGIITAERMNSIIVDLANRLDFDLENIGLVGAVSSRATSWSSVNSQVLLIPTDPSLAGPRGPDFWRAILLTIQQSVSGVLST